jgi:hypothetical protein
MFTEETTNGRTQFTCKTTGRYFMTQIGKLIILEELNI